MKAEVLEKLLGMRQVLKLNKNLFKIQTFNGDKKSFICDKRKMEVLSGKVHLSTSSLSHKDYIAHNNTQSIFAKGRKRMSRKEENALNVFFKIFFYYYCGQGIIFFRKFSKCN